MAILSPKRRKYCENLTNSTLADAALQAIFQKNPELRCFKGADQCPEAMTGGRIGSVADGPPRLENIMVAATTQSITG